MAGTTEAGRVAEALFALAEDGRGDAEYRADLYRRIMQPERWVDDGWQQYVPDEVVELWGELPAEARVIAYLLARDRDRSCQPW